MTLIQKFLIKKKMDGYQLTLDELEKQVIERCVYYTCERTVDNFIVLLKNEDNVRKARRICYENLSRKQLKILANEKCFFAQYENGVKKKYTNGDYIQIIIEQDEKDDRSKRWKLRNKMDVEKQKEERITLNERTNVLREQICQNYNLAKKLDTRIDELKIKENKTIPEYDELIDLLIQRLATKREITRIVDLN